MKTLLILAEHFPPAFSIGGKRPYRFARYLPDYGWNSVVVTKVEPDESRRDATPHPLPESVVLDRTLLPVWWKQSKGTPSDGTTAKPTNTIPSQPTLWKRFKDQLQLPHTSKRLFRGRIVSHLAALAKEHGVDAIYSTSSPYEMLGLGAALKERIGLPLVLDLRDPWSLNFTQRSKPDWYRRWVRRIEERCFEAADSVLFTCEAAAAAYREAYPQLPSDRIQTIYNSYDPALRPPAPDVSASRDTIDVVHFGNCYGPRRLKTVIDALVLLEQRGVPDAERIRLVNLGRPAKADLDLLDELGMPDRLTWGPFVPYAEGIQTLAESDVQLLLAYGDETLYVPAKTFDYFLTGAPMLCLTASEELRRMVESTSTGLVSAPRDVETVAQHLISVIAAWRAKQPVCVPDPHEVVKYSSPHTAAQLAQLLDSLM